MCTRGSQGCRSVVGHLPGMSRFLHSYLFLSLFMCIYMYVSMYMKAHMCVCVWLCIISTHVCRCPCRPEEGIRSHRDGAKEGCELLHVGARN